MNSNLFLYILNLGKTVYSDSALVGWGIIILAIALFLAIRKKILEEKELRKHAG